MDNLIIHCFLYYVLLIFYVQFCTYVFFWFIKTLAYLWHVYPVFCTSFVTINSISQVVCSLSYGFNERIINQSNITRFYHTSSTLRGCLSNVRRLERIHLTIWPLPPEYISHVHTKLRKFQSMVNHD
jgi:hypothetical protein